MPNTEVKLFNVDGTWRETARESRKLPEPALCPIKKYYSREQSWKQLSLSRIFIYSRIAQSAEHLTVNQRVVGSSPTARAKQMLLNTTFISIFALYAEMK